MFDSQFGKTVRACIDAVVPLADRDCPPFSMFRAVTEYISAPQRMCEPYCRHCFRLGVSLSKISGRDGSG